MALAACPPVSSDGQRNGPRNTGGQAASATHDHVLAKRKSGASAKRSAPAIYEKGSVKGWFLRLKW